MEFRDLIFKGAIRPALMFGIPIVPFILLVGIHLLVGMWAFLLVSGYITLVTAMFLVVEILILRQMNANDPHRLAQYFLHFRAVAFRRNKAYWGTHSMSPVKLKKR